MKKITKTLCFLLALLTFSSLLLGNLLVSAKCTENPYSQFVDDPYYEITTDSINGVRDKLLNLPASGNVNLDFLAQEILLHRASLITSAYIKSYTQNPELLDIIDDLLDDYYGEIKEMRLTLSSLIDSLKNKEKVTEDVEYMKDYKGIIDKLIKDLATITSDESAEEVYIKQNIAILSASNSLAKNNIKYSKNTLTKKIAENIINSTETYTDKLKKLETTFH